MIAPHFVISLSNSDGIVFSVLFTSLVFKRSRFWFQMSLVLRVESNGDVVTGAQAVHRPIPKVTTRV